MPFPRDVTLTMALSILASAVASAQPFTFSRFDTASVDGARGVVVADFDRNGWPDVAQANGSRNAVTILLNHDGALTRASDITVGRGPFAIATGDLNHDGTIDLAVSNADGNSISLLKGRGDGTFTSSTWAVSVGGSPRGVLLADVDLDGFSDLIFTCYGSNEVFVYRSDGDGEHFHGGLGFSVYRPQGIAIADFDHDGLPDLAIASEGVAGVVAILDLAGPNFPVTRTLGGPVSTNVLTIGDFNRDGWDDIAAASTNANRVAVYLGTASGPTNSRLFSTGSSPRGIDSGDLNLDGRLDLVIANRDSNDISVLAGTGTSSLFASPMRLAAGQGSRAAVVTDVDIDGLPDIVTGNQFAATVTLLTNTTALARAGYVMGGYVYLAANRKPNFSNIVPADFNRDGKPDVVFADTNNNLVMALTDGAVATVATLDPDRASRLAAADLDLDGCLDIVVFVRNASPGAVHT